MPQFPLLVYGQITESGSGVNAITVREGDELLEGFIKTINADTNEGRSMLINIWG